MDTSMARLAFMVRTHLTDLTGQVMNDLHLYTALPGGC